MATVISLKKEGDEQIDMSLLKHSPANDEADDVSDAPAESHRAGPEFIKQIADEPRDKFTPEQRKKKKLQIQRYAQRFAPRLESLRGRINKVSDLDDDELEALLDDVRLNVSNSNYKGVVNGAFTGAITVYESLLCSMSPIKPVGISKILNPSTNEEIDNILSELEIEYMPSAKYTSPLVRLAMAVGMGTAQCHARYMLTQDKKKTEDIKHNLDKPMDENASNVFEGL